MKPSKISKSDFDFIFKGHGHYKVVYTSPLTGKKWETLITDMEIIDATRNEASPKRKDLERLKRLCKW